MSEIGQGSGLGCQKSKIRVVFFPHHFLYFHIIGVFVISAPKVRKYQKGF